MICLLDILVCFHNQSLPLIITHGNTPLSKPDFNDPLGLLLYSYKTTLKDYYSSLLHALFTIYEFYSNITKLNSMSQYRMSHRSFLFIESANFCVNITYSTECTIDQNIGYPKLILL